MAKDLTIKQAKFLKEYFKTGNGLQSAMKVYDTDDPKSASVIAAENLAKLSNKVQLLMEAKGLSLGKLIDTINDATTATKIFSSHTEPDKEVPDYNARLKAVDIAGKWLGMEKPDILIDQRTQTNNLIFELDESKTT